MDFLSLCRSNADVFYEIVDYLPLIDLLAFLQSNQYLYQALYRGKERDIWTSRYQRELSRTVKAGTYETRRDDYIYGIRYCSRHAKYGINRIIKADYEIQVQCYIQWKKDEFYPGSNHDGFDVREILPIVSIDMIRLLLPYMQYCVDDLYLSCVEYDRCDVFNLLIELRVPMSEPAKLLSQAIRSRSYRMCKILLKQTFIRINLQEVYVSFGLNNQPQSTALPFLKLLHQYGYDFNRANRILEYNYIEEESLRFLLNIIVDPGARYQGLDASIRQRNVDNVRIYLEYGVRDQIPTECLRRAVYFGNSTIVRLLLEAGFASNNERDCEIAREYHFSEIYRLLRQYQTRLKRPHQVME